MLKADPEKLQHAIGISASRHSPWSAVAGKLTMMKNTVDPMATRAGWRLGLAGEARLHGPENVLDGKEGMFHLPGEGLGHGEARRRARSRLQIAQCGMNPIRPKL